MAKIIVAGELYEHITGQLFEIGRQLRQPSGYPFDPETLKSCLQNVIEGKFPRLALLKPIASVQVSGTQKFVAADAFGPNNPDGIKFYLWEKFRQHFLGKIENEVEPVDIAIHRLEKPARNPEIMAELGVEKRVIKLAHFYELVKAQSQGQEDPFLVNGYANIAYIEDENEILWAVHTRWRSFGRRWRVDADSVEDPRGWSAGYQVLSRK